MPKKLNNLTWSIYRWSKYGVAPIILLCTRRLFRQQEVGIISRCKSRNYQPYFSDLINTEVLNSCKKGIRIINVARGGIISEADLLKALRSGQCGGAGIDVYEQEPPTNAVTLELIAHDKVVATPHLGASTGEAQIRVAVEVSEQIIALTGKSTEYTSTAGVLNRNVLNNLKA